MQSCNADEFVAIRRPVAHRLFEEDIDTGFKQCASSVEVQIRRQQHVNCV